MPPEAECFALANGGFFKPKPKQSIMKPRLKFARVRIEWVQGPWPCSDCFFTNLNGWEPVSSDCMDKWRTPDECHPVIVANDDECGDK